MTAVVGIVSLLIGALLGAVALTRWYVWRLKDPDVIREVLKALYRRAHPNWLEDREAGFSRVCPCCGWSEKEGLAAGAEKCPGPTKKVDSGP